jgi:hypothetical protein
MRDFKMAELVIRVLAEASQHTAEDFNPFPAKLDEIFPANMEKTTLVGFFVRKYFIPF